MYTSRTLRLVARELSGVSLDQRTDSTCCRYTRWKQSQRTMPDHAKPLSTLHSCTARARVLFSHRSLNSVFLFYRDRIVVHEKKSEKPMGSERESFENLSRIYENKSFSEKINIWISMKDNFLFEEFTKINHVIHKKFQKSIYFPTRDSFPQKFSSLSSRLNCGGNTRQRSKIFHPNARASI